MTRNLVRRALQERSLTVGTWIQIAHPVVAEVLATAGFDWIAADCEHTDIGPAEFGALARGMYGRGTVPLVRVRENDVLAIRQMLDMGAQGVIVPLVNTPEEAARAVRAAKYPPEGIRGFAFHRGNNWGVDFSEYATHANDDIAVIVMIESKTAVEHIDDILAVGGVDGCFIGPYDMTGSYGIPGQTDAPVIKDACRQVVSACERAGKAAGIHVVMPSADAVERVVHQGFTFVAVGVDTVFLDQAARQGLEAAANAVGPRSS